MPNHTVTVTRTTTTSSTSAIILNTGYFRNFHGILKLLQLIACIIIVSIMSYCFDHYGYGYGSYTLQVDLYMHLAATACMVATFVILLSCLISITTASILPKTTFEYLYHGFAFLLMLAAGVAQLVQHGRYKNDYYYDAKIAAAVTGLVAAALYLISTILACRVYRIG